ncbi:carbohydrate-binding module family 48 protein [Suillus bovinus]|uniref:carbohydrate-binding module family 48 protein n=1 Tax=Suillus bovinus TaxID=48563 RepID=UPI001B86363A|nr:carbohydrate-binding module family 48 protein [Suillus bovinus]KAG2155811.1 carbohydrate-binding module family 48 protein [Suillus bovinus]
MGNTASHTNQSSRSPVPSRRIDSSVRRQAPSHSPSPNPHQPHRSLRTKKKSLELPDLASLSLTPAASYHNSGNSSPLSPYRRPLRTTSPIPIPNPAFNNGTMNNASNTGTSPRGRRPDLKGTANRVTDTGNYSAELLLDHPPSTHIPVHHSHRPRGSPYFRGAPLQYNSTHSFPLRGQSAQPRMQELYAESEIEESEQPDPPGFIQETVHSTIPLALHKAEEEIAKSANADTDGENGQLMDRPNQSREEPKETVSVKITWNGGGKSVVLVRAGDDNWKGRLAMEPDDPSSDKSWSARVPLMPGTHHIRFIVDEQWRVADDLPTAVDDEGSLANYVAVPISGLTPPHVSSVAGATPGRHPHPHAHSFWSTTSSTHGSVMDASDPKGTLAKWTDDIPAGLIAAAREEEAYLAYTASPEYDQTPYQYVPTPNIPPAPGLPRHLDKLILNAKPGQSPAGNRGRERDRERERERERESKRRQGRSLLGMTSTVARELHKEERTAELEAPAIPITTASGTDVTSAHLAAPAHTRLGLDGPGLSDDASVLPVPSHVVLHHLSTSAIRNGVLAVGNTTRYRTKYLTTIYYKPT